MVVDELKQISCAGIILYNPDIELLKKNVDALVGQVKKIYLFDNASGNKTEIERFITLYQEISYYRHPENAGIAFGLNHLLRQAKDDGFKWILTMDQDSICANNLVEEYSKFCNQSQIALVCPFVLNNGKYTHETYRQLNLPEMSEIINPIDCITSACLTNVNVISEIGGYATDFFIDGVDTELNCRVMQSGYVIVRANKTYLIQQMGKAKRNRVFEWLYRLTKANFFRRIQVAAVYNDLRLYYFARNNWIIHKKYPNAGVRTSTPFMIMLFLFFSITYPLSRSRIAMWKSILKGYKAARKCVV